MSEILFLAHRVPYPPNRGDKIRSWNVLKALSKIAPVHVVALCDDEADMAHADTVAVVASSVHFVPHKTNRLKAMATALLTGSPASVAACRSAGAEVAIKILLRKQPISAIYAFSGQMAQFVPDHGPERFIMDFVDVDSAKFEQWGNERSGLAGLANRFEAARLASFEHAVAAHAHISLFVSDAEAALFRARSGLGSEKVRAVENGIDLERFSPNHPHQSVADGEGPLIVFTGQMDYAPNVEAVQFFATQVLPHLDGARFAIVGRAPTAAVTALASLENVSVTGEVADPRDWIAAADIVVAPLLLARGVQNKVLEAMAMGKAVVATTSAASGIDAKAGRDLIIADGAIEQVEAIRLLLGDHDQRARLGQSARSRMEARYDWSATLAPLPHLIGIPA